MEQDHFAYRSTNPPRATRASAPPPGECSREVMIGDAGVYLALSRLLSWRIPAREAMNSMPYDVIADVPGVGMLRIQVKTTTRVTNGKLRYRLQRGQYYSPRGNFDYGEADYDIAAFVDLPKSKMLFCSSPRRSVAITPDWLDLPDVEHRSWLYALKHHDEAIRLRAARPARAPSTAADAAAAPAAAEPSGSSLSPSSGPTPSSKPSPSPPHPKIDPVPHIIAGPYRTFFAPDAEDSE